MYIYKIVVNSLIDSHKNGKVVRKILCAIEERPEPLFTAYIL